MVKINKKDSTENLIQELNSNSRKYGIMAILVLIAYVFGLSIFLFNANKEIKTIYKDIDNKRTYNQFIRLEIERVKQERINKIFSYDLKTDSEVTKFVNSLVSFNDKEYIPENLVGFNGTYIIDAKGNGTLRLDALAALVELNKDFYNAFNKNLVVVSSYRSFDYQTGIKNRGCPDNLCAKAGYSEHQSGLAVDLWETTTNRTFLSKPTLKAYFEWLNDNAHKFGFHNSYQKGLDVDGYEIEPWHWRYVGIDLATYLKENNITFAEFYNNK